MLSRDDDLERVAAVCRHVVDGSGTVACPG
jgi:hypothetical protein